MGMRGAFFEVRPNHTHGSLQGIENVSPLIFKREFLATHSTHGSFWKDARSHKQVLDLLIRPVTVLSENPPHRPLWRVHGRRPFGRDDWAVLGCSWWKTGEDLPKLTRQNSRENGFVSFIQRDSNLREMLRRVVQLPSLSVLILKSFLSFFFFVCEGTPPPFEFVFMTARKKRLAWMSVQLSFPSHP